MTFSSCNISGNQAFYVRLTLKISHRPDGIFTCFALALAERRCVNQQWLGDFVIVHHHWQHSYISACSCSKFLIAPMG